MIRWELKKLFKCKIGLIALALFIFLSGVMSFFKPTLETENAYRNDKYELVVDTRPKQEIAQQKFDKKIKQIKERANAPDSNEFMDKVKNTSQEYLSSMKYQEYKDVDFYKAINHRITHPFMSMIILIILVLIFSNIYTDEVVSGVDNIILSSKNKFRVLYSKVTLALVLPIVIYGLYMGIEFLITLIQYGTPINGGLGAFRIIDNGVLLNEAFTINEYLLFKIATMIVIFISISIFASFFSFISSNSLTSISAALIFIILGKACTLLKFLPNSFLGILSRGNYVDLVFYPQMLIGMYAGNIDVLGNSLNLLNVCNCILISTLIIGIILCIFTFKKILTR
ncbi:hypothetical protein OW763_15685 [Clostridium aestuarii]|uniref:ABC transporter permease n=1 Tax=Clostridium aestuarii TaxID=338193 RepID=A0ABT4D3E3_9CLOT|nr:hypothetical protein [Clostridium aestuarii]MCY6485766.1 hypothetical protein [Clostridium aestuarii]